MNPKTLTAAGVLALLLVAAAVYTTNNSGREAAPAVAEQLLLPDLRSNINAVTRVVIRSGADTVELGRTDDGWGASSKSGYPIKTDDLRKLLLDLSEMKLRERKTSNPEAFASIDLTEPGPDSAARQIEIYGADDKVLANVILGRVNYAQSGTGGTQFVRLNGENQTWLASSTIQVNTTDSLWMNTQFIDIENKRVKSVKFIHSDGEEFTVLKENEADANYIIADLPPHLMLKTPQSVNPAAGNHRISRFEDVVRRDTLALDPEKVQSRTITETFDGLIVTTEMYDVYGKSWLTLDVATREGEVEETITAEAGRIRSQVDGWAFTTPTYITERLTRRLDFFTQPIDMMPEAGDEESTMEMEIPGMQVETMEPAPEAEGGTEPGRSLQMNEAEEPTAEPAQGEEPETEVEVITIEE